MPSKSFDMSVLFPTGGLDKRHGFQTKPPFTTPDAINVWADDVTTGRDRGGRRPGTRKVISTTLPDAVRMLHVVNLASEDGFVEQLCASAGGQLYRHRASDDTWQLESTALRIADDRLVMATPLGQKLIIADWGITTSSTEESGQTTAASGSELIDVLEEATDFEIAGDGVSLTSATIGNFETAGVVAGTHGFRLISGGGTPGWYEIDTVSGTTITLLTSPGSTLSGLSGQLNVDQEAAGVTADDYRLLITEGSTNGTAGQYTITDVTDDEITVSGTIDTAGTSQIAYQTHRAPKVWDLLEGTVELLTASAGIVPLGCKIVTTHANRIFFSGDLNYPNMWYSSRANDETDYDYAELDVSRAVSATEYRGGQIGNPVTAMIPHNEDCLLFGTNVNFYVMRGDPADGGYITRISSALGPVAPLAWCRTDRDEVVMMTRDGVYVMPAGCGSTPYQMSRKRLPNKLLNIDTDTYDIQLAFDLLNGAVHVYLMDDTLGQTTLTSSLEVEEDGVTVVDGIPSEVNDDWTISYGGVGYGIERTTEDTVVLNGALPGAPFTGGSATWTLAPAFIYWMDWRRTLEDGSHPIFQMYDYGGGMLATAVCEYGPFSSKKVSSVVIGTYDGYACVFDRNKSDDLGTDFDAYVVIGPVRISRTPNDESVLSDVRVVSSLGADNFQWTVYSGATAEESMPGNVNLEDTWESDTFNASKYSEFVNLAGHAVTIKVEDKATPDVWSFEEFALTVHPRGAVR